MNIVEAVTVSRGGARSARDRAHVASRTGGRAEARRPWTSLSPGARFIRGAHQAQPFTRRPEPDGDNEAADASWAGPETLGIPPRGRWASHPGDTGHAGHVGDDSQRETACPVRYVGWDDGGKSMGHRDGKRATGRACARPGVVFRPVGWWCQNRPQRVLGPSLSSPKTGHARRWDQTKPR
ncbi:hypothetical protein FRAAL3140 [Frankia alni ACN14a]|uniref:Uncharacterized protein n=1 Tax=Frankia alni (strain DSM 45986 / CECT 9034 / ACN14a) TaxID=326424 RepID=Q0RL21_FRAAA|nr:hypothetical protein FRAAL3140 [Frankia alni ACN14a]